MICQLGLMNLWFMKLIGIQTTQAFSSPHPSAPSCPLVDAFSTAGYSEKFILIWFSSKNLLRFSTSSLPPATNTHINLICSGVNPGLGPPRFFYCIQLTHTSLGNHPKQLTIEPSPCVRRHSVRHQTNEVIFNLRTPGVPWERLLANLGLVERKFSFSVSACSWDYSQMCTGMMSSPCSLLYHSFPHPTNYPSMFSTHFY